MVNGIGSSPEVVEQRFVAINSSSRYEFFGDDIGQRLSAGKLTQQPVASQNIVDIGLCRKIIGMDDWIGRRVCTGELNMPSAGRAAGIVRE